MDIIKRGRPTKYKNEEERKYGKFLSCKKYKSKLYHCYVCNKDIVLNSRDYHNDVNKKHLKAIENFKTIENLD